ncbi:MAG: fluoride efflux transporter CrcB [Pseudanabaenaceae cyanobacterium bins.39]|nr:fluoride efflux transporter CrcB [Pseudanabaenaceae cyanobacterium bins.39]
MSEISEIIDSLAIAMGAVLGALARFYITEWSKSQFGTNFPYATFTINIIGCFAMGLVLPIAKNIAGYPVELDLLIRTGFLGSFTTFSTYGFDTLTLWRSNRKFTAIFYWAGSAVGGLLALLWGADLSQALIHHN